MLYLHCITEKTLFLKGFAGHILGRSNSFCHIWIDLFDRTVSTFPFLKYSKLLHFVCILKWLGNAISNRETFSFHWWNIYISGEYLIWRDQPWHFLIWRIWNSCKDCELKTSSLLREELYNSFRLLMFGFCSYSENWEIA